MCLDMLGCVWVCLDMFGCVSMYLGGKRVCLGVFGGEEGVFGCARGKMY